jgi:3-isopropylmalate/(R)-2-methylmalate dehydratase small subunit
MEKFTQIQAIAAPLPIMNVDTDMIIPKQFLKTIKRTGLGVNLFDEMRFREDGSEVADFVLNREPYRNAGIIISGENFGCGSSREHAPWSLFDFGIRCVIAPSFADIFYNNCFKNGILPIVLPKDKVEQLMQCASGDQPKMAVDLEEQTIHIVDTNQSFSFDVDPFRKECLINGLDDIGLTLAKEDKITAFEARDINERPWIHQAG